MPMSTLLVALLTAIIVWIFLVRKLTAKPWIAVSDTDDIGDIHAVTRPAPKIGLWVLFGSLSSLFALFCTAYLMRMDPHHHGSDWYPIEVPNMLWFNTGLLVLASAAMQMAFWAERAGNIVRLKIRLAAGGLLTIAFLAGQLLAWQQLKQSSYFDMVNPAVGFFYLLTAVHGLHLLGGLYVWAKTGIRLWSKNEIEPGSLSVELCTVYWHFLLLVWFILFALLSLS